MSSNDKILVDMTDDMDDLSGLQFDVDAVLMPLWPDDAAEAPDQDSDAIPTPLPASTAIKQPPNSWMMYKQDMWEEVKAQNPSRSSAELTQLTAKKWHAEGPEVQNLYKDRSRKLRAAHDVAHPEWKHKNCKKRKEEEDPSPQAESAAPTASIDTKSPLAKKPRKSRKAKRRAGSSPAPE